MESALGKETGTGAGTERQEGQAMVDESIIEIEVDGEIEGEAEGEEDGEEEAETSAVEEAEASSRGGCWRRRRSLRGREPWHRSDGHLRQRQSVFRSRRRGLPGRRNAGRAQWRRLRRRGFASGTQRMRRRRVQILTGAQRRASQRRGRKPRRTVAHTARVGTCGAAARTSATWRVERCVG